MIVKINFNVISVGDRLKKAWVMQLNSQALKVTTI